MHPVRHLTLLLPLCCGLLTGCDDNAGTIRVRVITNDGEVSSAVVSTDPPTGTVESDTNGDAVISDVPEGDYLVTATHDDLGRAGILVSVIVDESSGAIIRLPGFSPLAPPASLIYPTPDGESSSPAGLRQVFRAGIAGEPGSFAGVTVTWESDREGSLAATTPAEDGSISSSVVLHELGRHQITLTATYRAGRSARITVPHEVTPAATGLTSLNVRRVTGGIELDWSPWPGLHFSRYSIFRRYNGGDFESFAGHVDDREVTSLIDTTVAYNEPVRYLVQAEGTNIFDEESRIFSAPITFQVPSVVVGERVHKLLRDPTRSVLYATAPESGHLLRIDVNTMEILDRTVVGLHAEDVAISPDGATLYVGRVGANRILRIEAETMAPLPPVTLPVTDRGRRPAAKRLAVLADGHIAFTSNEEGAEGLFSLHLGTGTLKRLDTGSFSPPTAIVATADGRRLFTFEAGGGGQQVMRFENPAGTGFERVDESEGYDGTTQAVLSADERFVFVQDRKLKADDLSEVVGTFEHFIFRRPEILLTNADGSRAIGATRIYDAVNFTEVGPVRAPTRVHTYDPVRQLVFAFQDHRNTIIAYPF